MAVSSRMIVGKVGGAGARHFLGQPGRDELHGRALHRLGDRLGVAEVILLSLGMWTNVLRRHQASVVSQYLQLAAEMMRTHASFHAD